MAPAMFEWIENYVKSLVSQPDNVSLTTKEGVATVVVDISLASEDLALFDGRQNRLLKALNTVAGLAGARTRTRYVVKVSG